jgi:pimeloyl-ACP methyl ester carboxylesterase
MGTVKRSTAGLFAIAGLGAAAVAARGARKALQSGPDATDGVLVEADGDELVVESTDGARIAVRVAGPKDAGRTFVLAHCWTGDRRMWGPVARRLVADGHRVVTWDHRGHGRSTTGSDGYTIEALAADCAAVLDHLDVHDVVLAGHSMGGMTAQAALATQPSVRPRVAALALVATSCGDDTLTGNPRADQFGLRFMAHPALYRTMARPGVGPQLVRGVFGRTPARDHLAATAQCFAATQPLAVQGFAAAMATMDLSPHLPGFDLPTVVVIGSRDTLTPMARSQKIVALVPRAELVVLPDAGHMLPIERPAELTEILEKLAAG